MVDINNLEQLIESIKDFTEYTNDEDDNYTILLEKEGCSIKVQLHKQFYLINIKYDNMNQNFEGAVCNLTLYYIFYILSTLNKYPFVFISSFFEEFRDLNEEDEDDPLLFDLSYYAERLVYGSVEFEYFVKNVLQLESWNGESVDIPNLKNSDCSVCINHGYCIPYLELIIYKKDINREIIRHFTLYDWIIPFMEDMSWIDYDRVSMSPRDIGPLDEAYYEAFSKLFKDCYNMDVPKGSVYKKKIVFPVLNDYVLHASFFMNEVGILVKLYTANRPYKAIEVKLPYRNNFAQNVITLSKFLYLLTNDEYGNYMKAILGYYNHREDVYMGLLVK